MLVGFDGSVKVADFGIAKATRLVGDTTGTIKGKLSYMSPEQCQGLPLDRCSDIFALGVVLYELTTGARLYPPDTELAMLQHIVEGDVPRPSSMCPSYPPDLERIVMRALGKKPDERYATAQALQLELEEFARAQAVAFSEIRLARYLEALVGGNTSGWRSAHADKIFSAGREATIETSELYDAMSAVNAFVQRSHSPVDPSRRARGLGWKGGAALIGVLVVAALGLRLGLARTHPAGSAPVASQSPASETHPSDSALPVAPSSASASAIAALDGVSPAASATAAPERRPPSSGARPRSSSAASARPSKSAGAGTAPPNLIVGSEL